MPNLGANFSVVCQVQIEELLRPSGMLFLQLSNGTVISKLIDSAITTILIEFDAFTIDDFGKYYCNASITSPEFPDVGLRVFQGTNLENISKWVCNFTIPAL